VIAAVSEIFYSLQLEGTKIGYPAVFVRFSGCNLRCDFCDTVYAFEGGEKLSIEMLQERLSTYPCKRVIFTGGEPALQDAFMAHFMKANPSREYFIETNATLPLSESLSLFTHVVASPKLHAINTTVLAHLKRAANSVEFKFPVDDEEDLRLITQLVEELDLYPLVLQPIQRIGEDYVKKSAKLIEAFKHSPLAQRDARLIIQNQKIIYANQKGV